MRLTVIHTDVKSFRSRKPTEIAIEAGEDVSVWVFDVSLFSGKYPPGSMVNHCHAGKNCILLPGQTNNSALVNNCAIVVQVELS